MKLLLVVLALSGLTGCADGQPGDCAERDQRGQEDCG